ncbi:UGSC family (seleno)protein [Baekduia soli]|uniref:UGSC family (seleno)protein n=1 Tax=Baekduia soli TaxID=496014 RepID=UPI0016523EF3|nr:hypothetical protein [Baekduia soli]
MSLITVLRPDKPEAERAAAAAQPAGRVPVRPGATLLLIDNGKSHAKIVLLMVAEELRGRLPEIEHVEVFSKTSAAVTVTDDEARRLAEQATLVVTGLGDCGACSSCSVLDAITFERLGVPATAVITEPFAGLVAEFAITAGMPGHHHVTLPHPVATRQDAEVRALVAGVAGAIVQQLTGAASGAEAAPRELSAA